jgi:hypothetical protein
MLDTKHSRQATETRAGGSASTAASRSICGPCCCDATAARNPAGVRCAAGFTAVCSLRDADGYHEHVRKRPSNEALAALRERLQQRHANAGESSIRQTARVVRGPISHATVHAVLLCRELPTWRYLDVVVRAWGGDVEEYRQLWLAVEAPGSPPPGPDAPLADGSEADNP